VQVVTSESERMAKIAKTGPPPETLLPLPPATFHLLLALVDGERHGYAMMQEVAERTSGAVRLGPGTLYGSLKRLLEAGLVEEGGARTDPRLGDERRRYYRITKYGVSVARAEARRLEGMVRAARRKKLLGPEPA
jgi:DNA-binding PadR family transcriptional regulator